MKTPWTYCKLYFNIFDLDGYINKEDEIREKLPKGWNDAELDVKEGYVVITLWKIPTVEDGEKVKELLAEFV